MENSNLNWTELLQSLDLLDRDIKITLIKPIRTKDSPDDWYKTGKLTGFKSGLMGGGHSQYKHGIPHSFSSSKIRQIKPIMVQITYNVFQFGKKEYSDWVPVDNCIFEISTK